MMKRLLLCLLLLVNPCHLWAADLSITAGSVTTTSTQYRDCTAGATITAGQVVYIDASDGDSAKLADANASSTTATCVGIALNGASDGQPVRVQTGGTISTGATTVKGATYYVSATAGGIAPASDVTNGWYRTIIGVATDATGTIKMGILVSGVTET